MNIVVDSGNTYSKIGWFEGDELIRHESRLSFAELVGAVRATTAVDRILYASVSHPLEKFFAAVQPIVPVLHLDNQTRLPITKDYATPATLGVDRLAAAVGAVALFPGEDRLVIDMGTCITYDFVDQAACFQGGAISPGMRMRFKAMHSFTERLPLVEPDASPALIGKSTRDAMLSGVMNGLAAELTGFIDRYRAKIPACRVLICGGDAPYFEKLLPAPVTVAAELVLIGLNRILNHNVALQPQ